MRALVHDALTLEPLARPFEPPSSNSEFILSASQKMTNRTLLCKNCRQSVVKPRVNVHDTSTLELYTNLRTQYGPSALELNPPDINDILFQCDRDLEDYEYLVAQLSRILEQKKRLEQYRNALSSLRSPIRKLPTETLASIFDYACDQNIFQAFPWDEDSEDPPTTISLPMEFLPASSISSTCSRFHEVAISTASLWSRLKLEISSHDDDESENPAMSKMLELYLRRSKSFSLEIGLYVGGDVWNRESTHAFTPLLQQCRRWKTFEYRGHLTIDMFIQNEEEFDLLEKIKMGNGESLDIFERAPKLRELDIEQIGSDCSRFPWHQLTYLDIYGDDNSLVQIKDICPNLTALSLWEDGNDFITTPVIPCTGPFTRLNSLEVNVLPDSGDTIGLLDHIFSSFTCPSLLKLQIDTKADFSPDQAWRPWPKCTFNAFMSRSSCKITELSLMGVGISTADVISVLYLLTSLQDLSIDDWDLPRNWNPITSELMVGLHVSGLGRLLTTGKPSTCIVPRLRHISFTFSGTAFDDAAFISMILSRRLPNPDEAAKVEVDCLRSVVLKFTTRRVDMRDYQPLWDLEQKGMMVVVT
ncbi:hypothetical protein BT96DRAFT_976137 [Gymnopus androsaceus JB14]|uniref:Uncharacterized protein n=1 Tax=Gymnopus androsaceus JB14 TaxID=1447944 RepID=A0A6A4HQB1_9AGAR|nr:hypothetical protein BT96DRAFT_976137 [Gymnopus androsaceus JB14]